MHRILALTIAILACNGCGDGVVSRVAQAQVFSPRGVYVVWTAPNGYRVSRLTANGVTEDLLTIPAEATSIQIDGEVVLWQLDGDIVEYDLLLGRRLVYRPLGDLPDVRPLGVAFPIEL